jgi:hypothetical protein
MSIPSPSRRRPPPVRRSGRSAPAPVRKFPANDNGPWPPAAARILHFVLSLVAVVGFCAAVIWPLLRSSS